MGIVTKYQQSQLLNTYDQCFIEAIKRYGAFSAPTDTKDNFLLGVVHDVDSLARQCIATGGKYRGLHHLGGQVLRQALAGDTFSTVPEDKLIQAYANAVMIIRASSTETTKSEEMVNGIISLLLSNQKPNKAFIDKLATERFERMDLARLSFELHKRCGQHRTKRSNRVPTTKLIAKTPSHVSCEEDLYQIVDPDISVVNSKTNVSKLREAFTHPEIKQKAVRAYSEIALQVGGKPVYQKGLFIEAYIKAVNYFTASDPGSYATLSITSANVEDASTVNANINYENTMTVIGAQSEEVIQQLAEGSVAAFESLDWGTSQAITNDESYEAVKPDERYEVFNS